MDNLLLISNLVEAFIWLIGGVIVLCIQTELPGTCQRSYKVSKRWLATTFLFGAISIFIALTIGKFQGGQIEFLSIYSLLGFYIGFVAILLSFTTLHNYKNLTLREFVVLFCPTFSFILLHLGAAMIWGMERVYSFEEYVARIGSSPTLVLRGLILLSVIGGVSGALYKFFRARKQYNAMINDYFSGDEEKRRSKWIDHYFVFLIIMLFFVIASALATSLWFDLLYGAVLTSGMVYLVVKFINYQTIFFRINPAIEYADEGIDAPKESPDSVVGVLLQQWMARGDKPFLQNGLSLNDVSHMVGIGRRKLSAHINIKYGMTFNSWINMLRIQEVERMLKDSSYDELSLSQIASKTGFSDLAAMSNVFKKVSNQSPSSFRKAHRS